MDKISRPYEYLDNVHVALSYEFDRNLVTYEREAYTTFEWFGNVGGLAEGLHLFFGMFVMITNYNFYKVYMVSELLQAKETTKTSTATIQRGTVYKEGSLFNQSFYSRNN